MRSGALLVAATGASPAANAATRVDLNRDWAFRIEAGAEGGARWLVESHAGGRGASNVPHTWNRAGANYDYPGRGLVLPRLDLPKLPADAIAQLHFGAAFYKARVLVNGVGDGEHEGGYSAFRSTSRRICANAICSSVAVDNRPGMYTIPGFGARGAPDAWYDWWAYGGIVRDVWLERARSGAHREPVHSLEDRRHERHRHQSRDTGDAAAATRHTARNGRSDPIGKPAAHARRNRRACGRRQRGADDLHRAARHPALGSRSSESLSHERSRCVDAAGKVARSNASESFGLRDIAIRDRHLLINGERVRLTGMTRHADSPWEGLAETRGTLRTTGRT